MLHQSYSCILDVGGERQCKLLCCIAWDICPLLLIILDSCVFVINWSLKGGKVVRHTHRGATLAPRRIAVALKILHIHCFLITVQVQYVFCCCIIICLPVRTLVIVHGCFIPATPGESSHWVSGHTVREQRSWEGYMTIFGPLGPEQ